MAVNKTNIVWIFFQKFFNDDPVELGRHIGNFGNTTVTLFVYDAFVCLVFGRWIMGK